VESTKPLPSLAGMAATVYAMESVTRDFYDGRQQHYDIRLEAAMAKLSCTEAG
jgi:hypothetical protein